MAAPAALTLDEIHAYIKAIDFSLIVNKLVCYGGWLKSDADKTCELYRNFLFLSRKYQDESLPPSEDIDEFWHAHILDTEKYHQDCAVIFGSYRHHYPYFGIDANTTHTDLENAFTRTQALHLAEFGEPIVATRASRPRLLNTLLYQWQKRRQ